MSAVLRSVSARWRLALLGAAAVAALVVGVLAVQAEPVPRTFAYQGVLTDAAGNPITGTHSVTMRVYADGTTGTALCTETEAVTVTNGLFRMVVGDGGCAVDPAWFTRTAPVYLGITVDTTTLSPRVPLFPVASAYQAEHAEDADRVIARFGSEFTTVAGVYCGATTPTSGSFGGYTGAKNLCEAACADGAAHMCTADELSRSLQLGMTVPDGWYSLPARVFTGSVVMNDCCGWTGCVDSGPEWTATGPLSTSCGNPSITRPGLCCL